VASDPPLARSLMDELTALLEGGVIPPLPVERAPFAEASRVFRMMAETRHIGKLVLVHGGASRIASNGGSYLVTGGFGALGLEAAAWLAGRGVDTVILAGRRRRRLEAVAALKARGLTVIEAVVDCADPAALRRLIAALPPARPLRGVVHCAGVLADATLPRQSAADFTAVASAKFGGALALHQATAELALDAFILFSSAAAVLGSAGQANYAAANAAMDAIARLRGYGALSVGWGPWEMGMTDDDRVRRRTTGLSAIGVPEGFAALERLLGLGCTQAVVLPAGWLDERGRPTDQFLGATAATAQVAVSDLSDRLRALPTATARVVLRDHVRAQLAKVLGSEMLTPIAPTRSLQELGLDSLMSVELRNLLAKSLRIAFSATLALDYPTLEALCDHLLQQIAPAADDALDETALIAGLSDDEAEAMLRRELASLDV
jgi:acyl carrier protein